VPLNKLQPDPCSDQDRQAWSGPIVHCAPVTRTGSCFVYNLDGSSVPTFRRAMGRLLPRLSACFQTTRIPLRTTGRRGSEPASFGASASPSPELSPDLHASSDQFGNNVVEHRFDIPHEVPFLNQDKRAHRCDLACLCQSNN